MAVIQALGEHLKLRQQVIATATVYFKRFYARWAGRCLGYSLLIFCTNVYLSSRLMALFKCTCMKVKERSWLVSRYSLKSIDPVLMAPTCVFLASKVEVNTVWIWPFLLKDASIQILMKSTSVLNRNLVLFRTHALFQQQRLCVSDLYFTNSLTSIRYYCRNSFLNIMCLWYSEFNIKYSVGPKNLNSHFHKWRPKIRAERL